MAEYPKMYRSNVQIINVNNKSGVIINNIIRQNKVVFHKHESSCFSYEYCPGTLHLEHDDPPCYKCDTCEGEFPVQHYDHCPTIVKQRMNCNYVV